MELRISLACVLKCMYNIAQLENNEFTNGSYVTVYWFQAIV